MMGKGSYFPGLIPMVFAYLDAWMRLVVVWTERLKCRDELHAIHSAACHRSAHDNSGMDA